MAKHRLTAFAFDKRGRLIAQAENNYTKSHPVQAHFAKLVGEPDKIYLHAEIAVLLKCGDVVPHTLQVIRYYKSGKPALARPCAVCQAAIKSWGVKQVLWSD